MEDLKQYKKDFKKHLEDTYNSSQETDDIKKIAETEKTIPKYVTKYFNDIKGSSDYVENVDKTSQTILDNFIKSKINLE